MKNVLLIVGLGVVGYAWYRDQHRAGGGVLVSTANIQTPSLAYNGGIAGTSGGGTAGQVSASTTPIIGMQGNMKTLPVYASSPDAMGMAGDQYCPSCFN